MYLQYGKAALDIVHTNAITRQAVLSDDGCDYLYTHWVIDVHCVMNPATAMAVNAALTPTPGTPSSTADTNIRHPLMIPRQTLVLSTGLEAAPTLLLRTPATGYSTDAANGPIPLHFSILENIGDKTFLCRYVIEARVNECPVVSQSQPRSVILSQRWTQSMDVDQDHFGIRTTQRVVVFRSDELLKQNVSPDQLRTQLGHPIPANMKRDGIRVTQESDGLTLRYEFKDTELPFNFRGVPGMTRFECYQTNWSSMENPEDTLMNFLGNVGGDFSADPFHTAGQILRRGVGVARAGIPKFRTHVLVRVWGDRTSLRQSLAAWGLAIAIARIPEFFDPTAYVGREISVTQDIGGKFIEISMIITRGPNPTTLLFLFNLPGNDQFLGFGNGDTTVYPNNPAGGNPFPNPKLITQDATVAQPIPNNTSGTRGTNLSVLVAAALGMPCTAPASPVNYSLTSGSQAPS